MTVQMTVQMTVMPRLGRCAYRANRLPRPEIRGDGRSYASERD